MHTISVQPLCALISKTKQNAAVDSIAVPRVYISKISPFTTLIDLSQAEENL